jgi:4-amino-4-deoxy-L-arabinose transferase-like glycosyltransferase
MVAIGFPTNGVTRLDSLIACARSHPAAALIVVLAAHLLVWTAIPILLGQGPPLDLVEGLALGKEWQLGYWKHPPLPWWVDEFTYQLTGTPRSVFLLGPLSAVICMYFVWRLAREVMEATGALIAAISLEGIHFFNHSAVEFNHNVLQLPLWAGAFWVFYRALVAAGSTNWMLAGACLGFAFWTKYSAVVLAATLVLVLLVDPIGRKSLRTPGPYLMALITLLVIAPHLTWLAASGFLPLAYADQRAIIATQWHQYLYFPLQFALTQLSYLLPVLILLAISLGSWPTRESRPDFSRRYVMIAAFGPFVMTMIIATLSGRELHRMWAYPFWSFLPLALVMCLNPVEDTLRLRRFTAGFLRCSQLFPSSSSSAIDTSGLSAISRARETFQGENWLNSLQLNGATRRENRFGM